LISVCIELESSSGFLPFFQALQRHAILPQVDAVFTTKLIGRQLIMRWLKSSPPRCVSPLVLFTSKHHRLTQE
jgi:hypothetical protein